MDENTKFEYRKGFTRKGFAGSVYIALAFILASIGLWYLWSLHKTFTQIQEQTITNTQNITAIATFLNQQIQAAQLEKRK